ncbi:MAG: alpha/beta hydrolase [Burkholderiales bacterium]|nr:alpha/beta hydrolase [Burkholderiales bacterium]MDE2289115.1 alpha/beta hydrolase [Burkholderiales bacterium]MDE2609092.1 alpha/beta hydrolase [Burkholderiales bacterium]
MKTSCSEFVDVRGLRYHVRRWGPSTGPKLFLLHGWMDVAASFQFLADALPDDWQLIAPDWRGFGQTDWPATHGNAGCYWFPDYLADLEALLDHYAPGEMVDLVGHSMGANVVCLYAGIRPARVRRVVDLEGFGLPATVPTQAAGQFARWLDEMREPPQLKRYASLADVVARLRKNNPRLSQGRAEFLAPHWSRQTEAGDWEILGDPAHKIANPFLYRLDEIMAVWRNVAAPVLHVEARDSETLRFLARRESIESFRARFQAFADFREVFLDDAGHMVHHDQPEALARLIDDFCRC